MHVDASALADFENGLNPAFPEKSRIPPEILGYGEITTTFRLPSMPDIAFKRLPPFQEPSQIARYRSMVETYRALLSDRCGIRVAPFACYDLVNHRGERILFMAQPRFSRDRIGNILLKACSVEELKSLVMPVMAALTQILAWNQKNSDQLSIGIDGQLSNWSFPTGNGSLPVPMYFDITTPMFRVEGREQLDTEIFLKSCPSFLVWLVRRRFLPEVLDRYYDMRLVLMDLVANFYKEGRPDLITPALTLLNAELNAGYSNFKINPLEKYEIERYYKNDAFIWSLFLSLRRFDRFLKTKIFRKRYNFILPGKISR